MTDICRERKVFDWIEFRQEVENVWEFGEIGGIEAVKRH